MNSPRASSSKVVGVESIDHAESVVKALRATSLSQKRYQRNAENENQIIQSMKQFDTIVSEKGAEVEKSRSMEVKMNDAIAATVFNKVGKSTTTSKPTKEACESSSDEDEFYKQMKRSLRPSSQSKKSSPDTPPHHAQKV